MGSEWLDKTTSFSATTGSYSGGWVPAHPLTYSLVLSAVGFAGFRPTQVRLTFTGAEAEGLSTFVKNASDTTLNDTTQLWTGFDVDSDLSVGTDITKMTFAAWDSFVVTKIEFYGEEVVVAVDPAVPGTGECWGSRGRKRGRKHNPLATRTRR